MQNAAAQVALAARDLHFGFSKRTVLDGLEFAISPGELYALLGRNGAGKTTTLKLLLGVLRPRRGEIEVGGARVAWVDAELRRRIGYVPQRPKFYPWMRGRDLARFVGALHAEWSAEQFRRHAADLQVDVDLRVREMSAGTVVKLALAIALSVASHVVVLDEPTAGLDPVVRREVLAALRAEAEVGRTILFSSHEIAEVEAVADRVGVLRQGKMAWEGSIDRVGSTFRWVDEPVPDFVEDLGAIDGRRLGRAEDWGELAHRTAPAALSEVFYALTRDS